MKADFTKKLAVSGSWDTNVKIWDLSEFKLIRTLKGHSQAVRALDVNFDTELIFSGDWDGGVRVWNVRSGLQMTSVTAHNNMVRGIAANVGDDTLFCIAWGCTCQGAADAYGIQMSVGFEAGLSPKVRLWFMAHRCTTSAKACKDYTADTCSAKYCYLNNAGIVTTCSGAPPTPVPTMSPTFAPTPAPTKKFYHPWYHNVPVIGPILKLIMDLLGNVPVVGEMLKKLNAPAQAISGCQTNL